MRLRLRALLILSLMPLVVLACRNNPPVVDVAPIPATTIQGGEATSIVSATAGDDGKPNPPHLPDLIWAAKKCANDDDTKECGAKSPTNVKLDPKEPSFEPDASPGDLEARVEPTKATFYEAGRYELTLTADDSEKTGSDSELVKVLPDPNARCGRKPNTQRETVEFNFAQDRQWRFHCDFSGTWDKELHVTYNSGLGDHCKGKNQSGQYLVIERHHLPVTVGATIHNPGTGQDTNMIVEQRGNVWTWWERDGLDECVRMPIEATAVAEEEPPMPPK